MDRHQDPAGTLGALRLSPHGGGGHPLLLLPDRPGVGPAFLKVCGYAPYAIKLCLNGHEWVKRHLQRRRRAFTAWDNGFLSSADPAALQAVCDHLSAADIEAFFTRWLARLPLPLAAADYAAGFTYRLSVPSSLP